MQERDVIVLEDVVAVAPHLVGDERVGPALPAAERHVEAVVVEEQPDLGLLGGRGAFDRLLLSQIGTAGTAAYTGFVETPVDVERRLEAHGPQRDAAVVVARHGGWSGRRHRAIGPRLPGRGRQRQRDDRCGNEGRRSQRQQRGAPGEGKDANGKRRPSLYPTVGAAPAGTMAAALDDASLPRLAADPRLRRPVGLHRHPRPADHAAGAAARVVAHAARHRARCAAWPPVWRDLRRMPPRLVAIYLGIGVLVTLHWITFYGSIKLSNASVAATCMALTPVFVSIIEPSLARRPPQPRRSG